MERITKAYTFDDLLLQPGYAGFSRSEVKLNTKLTQEIDLAIPLVSSPMDTVTEARLAIALGELGGIGIIHRNLEVAAQAKEVAEAKGQGVLVGAAVGSSPGYEARVDALIQAGVDVLVVDSAHGHAEQVVKATKYIVGLGVVQVISGNVATWDGAGMLCDAGTNALRVGMGPGSICSTRIITGMGVPQITAIMDTVECARDYGVPVIADGGIVQSGDITKALAAGAHTVMLGSKFAGTHESPGESFMIAADKVPGRFKMNLTGATEYPFKNHRGMGSIGAMKRGAEVKSEDEFHGKTYNTGDPMIAEGVEGFVPVVGSVKDLVDQLMGGLTSGMYDVGARTISELWDARFYEISQSSLKESHPHDLYITNTGGNYQL